MDDGQYAGGDFLDERYLIDFLDERYLIDRAEHEAHVEGNEEGPDDDVRDSDR